MNRTDTIIALATPPGEGGLAIIRISGVDAKSSLDSFFRPSGHLKELESHRLYHGYLKYPGGQNVDEVMVVYMQPPRSYTCEEVVEIQCHGGQQVVKAILGLYISHGLRLAQPGEFTYRAFMNGRLDLAQAEAVSRLIHSRSEKARSLALSQVEGRLSQAIHQFTATLKRMLVLIEAWIDFPEEGLPEEDAHDIKTQATDIASEIAFLLDTFQTGKVYVEGLSVLLLGRPNAGKSSLLNALLGEERAIVTNIPGTTRDTLEEGVTVGGVPVRLIDTAGFRQTDDPVEIEGVRRAREKINSTDLVLLLVDGSQALHPEDLLAYEACGETTALLVVTKTDIAKGPEYRELSAFERVDVSSKTGAGIDLLREKITRKFVCEGSEQGESVVITEKRHHEALSRCRKSLQRIVISMENGLSLEFVSSDIRDALFALGEISGQTTSDDILADIFSSFCIGK